MSEQVVTSVISANAVRAHVEHITTAIPSRLAGSDNAKRMAEYSAGALGQAGVAATIFEMPGLVSFPAKAELRVRAPTESPSRPTPSGTACRRSPTAFPAT